MITAPTPEAAEKGRIFVQLVFAFLLGTVLTVFVVLPAEYNIDPTGFGRLTGLDQISAPREIVVETKVIAPPEIARLAPAPFREDTLSIPLGALGEGLGALEYKVTMARGEALVYSWTASAPVVYEFHGHTVSDDPGVPIEVMDYVKDRAAESHGALIAPMDGIHGWYFANPGFEPITIELRLAGYYVLEPGIIGIR